MNSTSRDVIGLMLSGGIDSAVLLSALLDRAMVVQPIYVSMGCVWDEAERKAIDRFIEELDSDAVLPLVEFSQPVDDLYGRHWSLTGEGVPDEKTADEAVFLWGRNPMLLLKPLLWCQQHAIHELALGTLDANPFADATKSFLDSFADALLLGLETPIRIVQPFQKLTKQQVVASAMHLPIQHTFSCLAPVEGIHCGRCNKCAERKAVLKQLPGGDPTRYSCNNTLVASR